MNSIRSNNVSLKYQRFATFEYKDYKFRVCGKDSIPFCNTQTKQNKLLKKYKDRYER